MYLEIPVEKDLTDDEVSGDTKEEKKQAKKDAKKFRFIIGAGNSSSSSVYSRTSLAESVSREDKAKPAPISREDEDQMNQKFPQAQTNGTETATGTTEGGHDGDESSIEKAPIISAPTDTVERAPAPVPVS